ncbi:hypothetical protein CERZMDRAFT_99027 [Cercospora zeae-maydis SCOH1-5]|uniref:Uncharacterized protein n=1 Tax=Cercospora zeae-maydis SCOH1-5 TaxID=717836 RepID=A0A6A6FC20_9PEZI|nr:hypothetical protein CERZMDRAFT_99027 [Cercospora zeae-maydis SCOH1-5]
MPTLKQISCSLEVGSNTRLKEYGHSYTDGGVEAFVAIPDAQIPFRLRVTSTGYIAPGLAAYVFMDGVYQCNRNRQRLTMPSPASLVEPHEYEVDFTLRQKEEKTSDGLFVAREWTAPADRAPDYSSSYAQSLGTIEVVILRCKDGGGRHEAIDPAHTVVHVRSAKASHPRPASVVQAASETKPGVKAPSQVPATKAPTKPPSSKAASEADAFGGMFGLFDGAPDDPFADCDGVNDQYRVDNERDAFRYATRRRPPPDYQWDARQGLYRHVPALDRYPQRFVDDSLDVQPTRSNPPSLESHAERGDFVFVEESAKQIGMLIEQGSDQAKKHFIMEQEAIAHRRDPEVFQSMTSTLQRKAQEIANLNDEISGLYRSIDACMRSMDKQDWQRVRGFLHQQRILPEMRIELATPLPTPVSRPVEPADDDWQPFGTGKHRASLSERKRQQQNQRAASNGVWQTPPQTRHANQDIDGTGKWTQDNALGPHARDSPHTSNDGGTGRSNQQDDANQDGGTWGQAEGGNDAWGRGNGPQQEHGGWPANEDRLAGDDWKQLQNDQNKESDGNTAQHDGWGGGGGCDDRANNGNSGDAQDGAWGNPGENKDGNDQADDWNQGQDNDQPDQGVNEQDVNAPDAWAGQQNDDQVGGWGNEQKAGSVGGPKKAASQASAWRNDGAQHKAPTGIATTVSALRPVIKPYWGEWATRADDQSKPRAQPRDAYVYPAPPSIAAPPGKAPSVSHGVQAGRGANYMHKLHRPEYLDTMQQPYAIFTFKYRSKDALEKILGRKIDTSNLQKAAHEVEQEKLMRLPKDELVAELMRRQTLGTSSIRRASRIPLAEAAATAPSKTGRDEVKPSDSVSNANVANSDDWQEVGQGAVQAGNSVRGTSEGHWGKNDPQLNQTGGGAVW